MGYAVPLPHLVVRDYTHYCDNQNQRPMMSMRLPPSSEALPLPEYQPCQAVPRAGVPLSEEVRDAPFVALPQRMGPGAALALAAAGFPGLSLDRANEQGVVERARAEGELDRLALAYLRADQAVGALPSAYGMVLTDLMRQVEQQRPHGLRIELSGPLSLAMQLVDEYAHPLIETPALREALGQHLVLRGSWLHEQLSLTAGGSLICLDEPFLETLDSPFCPIDREEGFALLSRTLADLPPPRGLCVAGVPDWSTLVALPVELIFFDAYGPTAGLTQASVAVAEYLERGGMLAWGAVPTDPQLLHHDHAELLAQRMIRSVNELAATGATSSERIWAATLITTTGRLSHLPVAVATEAALRCHEVAHQLRQVLQLEP